MMWLCSASLSRAVLIGILFCAVQAFAEPASTPSAVGGTDESVGEVELASPKPHALIQYGREKIRTLQAVGDVLFHPRVLPGLLGLWKLGPPAGCILAVALVRNGPLAVDAVFAA